MLKFRRAMALCSVMPKLLREHARMAPEIPFQEELEESDSDDDDNDKDVLDDLLTCRDHYRCFMPTGT